MADELAERYPLGTWVRYTAGPEVHQDDAGPSTAEGPVNGSPIEHDGRVFVPVWTERDHGREPTTVYVNEQNIISAEHPRRKDR